LRDNLTDLGRVLDVLGPTWRVIYSDALRDSGGNNERVGFVYDKRAVAIQRIRRDGQSTARENRKPVSAQINWWREPFMASFSAGSFDFVLLAAHAQWGTPAGRLVELQSLAEWIDLKRKEKTSEDKDLIIVGDFNIEDTRGARRLDRERASDADRPRGQVLSARTSPRTSATTRSCHYPGYPQNFSNQAGVVDFYSGGLNDLFPGVEKDRVYLPDVRSPSCGRMRRITFQPDESRQLHAPMSV